MANQPCNYHQTGAAVWRCADCIRDFCPQCVVHLSGGDYSRALPRCALCQGPLSFLGTGNMAKPFWSVAGTLFLYPFKVNALIALGFLTLCGLMLGASLFGLAIALFSAAVLLKYGLAVLNGVAYGELEAPAVFSVITGDEDNIFLKFVGMMLIVGLVSSVFQLVLGDIGTQVFTLIVSIASPAMLILLAIERTISSALNPARMLSIMTAVGWPYLLVVVLTNVISSGPLLVFSVLGPAAMEASWFIPALMFVVSYFSIVHFALLGYVLFENQSELGFVSGDPDDLIEPNTHENVRKQVLGTVSVLVKERRNEDALALLAAQPKEMQLDPVFIARRFAIVKEVGGPDDIGSVADLNVAHFLDQGAPEQALETWRTAQRINNAYLPGKAAWRHRLAVLAYDKNLPQQAAALLMNLHKCNVGYAGLPDAYKMLETILIEQGRIDQAAQVRVFLKTLTSRVGTPGKPRPPGQAGATARATAGPSAPDTPADADDSGSWSII